MGTVFLMLNEKCAAEIGNAAAFDALMADAEASADWLQAHAGEFKDAPECARKAMLRAPVGIGSVVMGECFGADMPETPCLVSEEKLEELFGGTMEWAATAFMTAEVVFGTKTLEVCHIDEACGAELIAEASLADIRAAIAAGPVDSEDGVPRP